MSNTERFDGRAAAYKRYRQRYPEDAICSKLKQWCGLQPSWLIADIGAGTGMLTEVFLANSNTVVAVEPNGEMRSICSSLCDDWPGLSVVDGTAEHTTLLAGSIDMVTAGRAFHWFDTQPALREFRRVLRPGGWLSLVSLGRAKMQDPQSIAFEHLLTEHGTDIRYLRSGYRIHDKLDEVFSSDLHQAQLHSEQHLDWPTFLGQCMSFSMVPQQNAPRFPGFQNDLQKHFDEFAVDGLLTLKTTCWISAGHI